MRKDGTMPLSREQRGKLVALLLSTPPAPTFAGRTVLLGACANVALNRDEKNARTDFETIVDQLDRLGATDKLVGMIENAIAYVQGTTVGVELAALVEIIGNSSAKARSEGQGRSSHPVSGGTPIDIDEHSLLIEGRSATSTRQHVFPVDAASVDVAVLTAIPVEFDAVRDALNLHEVVRSNDPRAGTVCFRGSINSELAGRHYSIAVACIGRMGRIGAAAAVQEMITSFKPRIMLLVGIAAGIRGKVRVGEVVLSERIVAYEPAALVRGAGGAADIHHRPEIDRMPHGIAQDIVSYRPDPKRLRQKFVSIGGVFPRTGVDPEQIATTITARPATIASGEKLLRDPAQLVALREAIHEKTEVGETEAAGFVEACRCAEVPWLVIRGISDFGDESKDDRFHEFAARAAATVLSDFLGHGLDVTPSRSATISHQFDTKEAAKFILGCPIDRDEDFVGREQEQRTVLNAIELGQPVQLIGESLMGKTSLLRWIQRNAVPDRPVVWLDPTRGLSPATMVASIAKALKESTKADALRQPVVVADDVARVLEEIVPFVLLIDDADTLATLGSKFDVGFFNIIRALVQERKLTWISASYRNLYELFQDKGLTSAFLNDARKVRIGPMDERASIRLAQRIALRDADAPAILREVGGFAYGLQWLGDHVHRRKCSFEQARDAFANEMEAIYQRWWAGLDLQQRQLLKKCANNAVKIAGLEDRPRRKLRALVDRGLLVEQRDEGQFVLEGEAWRGFVHDVS